MSMTKELRNFKLTEFFRVLMLHTRRWHFNLHQVRKNVVSKSFMHKMQHNNMLKNNYPRCNAPSADANSVAQQRLKEEMQLVKPNTSVLAGNPRETLAPLSIVRHDVLKKWDQRPRTDVNKEWTKNSVGFKNPI